MKEMLEGIDLNCGRTPNSPPLALDAKSGLTIFVGPNNCGKSALLENIFQALAGKPNSQIKLKGSALHEVRLTPFSDSMFEKHPLFTGRDTQEVISFPSAGSLTKESWKNVLSSNWKQDHGKAFRQMFCIWMNGAQRLSMLPDENSASLIEPVGPLAKLLSDNKRRAAFQSAVYDGIAHYPIVDCVSKYGTLKLAFSLYEPDPIIERSLEDESVRFIQDSTPAPDASDGFNAYVGILGVLYASDYKAILIDEPEAFLHPALARALGKQIARQSDGKHVFIATHSAEILIGAVESGVPVRIVRLQYENGVASACLLDSEELKAFMNDPLLRSANVLSGLFSRSVVVAEADADRSFYQEVNSRLLAALDGRGIDNALFLNAQNKHTVPRIVKLLRRMGVPSAGIVDLDVVSEGGENWAKQIRAIGIPGSMRTRLEAARVSTHNDLKRHFSTSGEKSYKRLGGVYELDTNEKEAALSFLSALGDYGLFVVPIGEVEAWLQNLDIKRSKHSWLHSIFSKMGSDPLDAEYLHPQSGDVWDFIGDCNAWLSNPLRKGLDVFD